MNNGKKYIFRGIVLPLLALLVISFDIFFVYYVKMSAAAEQRAFRLLADASQSQSVAMKERITASYQQLGVIGAGVDWNSDIYSSDAVYTYLQDVYKAAKFDNLAIGKPSGELLYQNGSKKNCADRSYFQKALKGEANVEYLSKGRLSGDTVFVFAVPVYEGTDVVGVIAATKNLRDISRELGSVQSDVNQASFLCTEDGEIIAPPRSKTLSVQSGGLVQNYFIGADNAKIAENEVHNYTYCGKPYYGIYTASGLNNIYIFSAASKSYASNLAGVYSKWSMGVALFLFVLTLLAGFAVILILKRRISMVQAFELEQRKKLEEYHEFQNKRSAAGDGIIGSFYMNLKTNTCRRESTETVGIEKLKYDGTADGFVEAVLKTIHPMDRERYRKFMSRENLLSAFEAGIKTVHDEFLFYGKTKNYVWLRVVADFVRDPVTDEPEAWCYAVNVNREKRLEQIGKKMIAEDFEAMGLIDPESGCVYGIKALGDRYVTIKYLGNAQQIDYNDAALQSLKKALAKQDFEEVKDAVRLSTVKKALETEKEYSVTIHENMGSETVHYYKISYSYLDERRESIVLSCEDITNILQSKMDVLTGLYNSTGFHEKVDEWLKKNPGRKYRLLRYNIDGFKNINGTFGFSTGNKLLQNIGAYMRKYSNENSIAGRLNSDHFVRFCAAEEPSAELYYEYFRIALANSELNYPVSVHIGVYDLCEEGCDSYSMSYKAHLAQQSVKGNYSKAIAYYQKGMMQSTREEQQLLGEVERAIDEKQFELWFQPQYDYEEKKIVGAEALVRWRHPTRGLLMPGTFVPLLEQSKQITMLDHAVWEQAAEYIKESMNCGLTVPIAVNVSQVDICNSNVCEKLIAIVRKYDIPPALLHVEITESAFVNDAAKLTEEVSGLKKAGFTVEMDDFGVGYSSLGSLMNMDIDILKIDRKLVSEIESGEQKSLDILKAVVQMAHTLNITPIAEGVEEKSQADYLSQIGCRYMQGFYFSKPVEKEAFEALLSRAETDGDE